MKCIDLNYNLKKLLQHYATAASNITTQQATFRMPKIYEPINSERRRVLLDLIHNRGMNISQAAKATNIFYPTAKAINKVFKQTGRTDKKLHRNKKQSKKSNKKRNSTAERNSKKAKITVRKQQQLRYNLSETTACLSKAETEKVKNQYNLHENLNDVTQLEGENLPGLY